ncbi:MAG: hypothetical protein LBB77_11310 [Treponema sp.]|jgi:hypothetical protein|nr:hypothetical protein [Treponema sp.]
MQNKTTLIRLKTKFNRLSKERQAEILGMAKALTYAQQTETFDLQAFIQEITQESRARPGSEK